MKPSAPKRRDRDAVVTPLRATDLSVVRTHTGGYLAVRRQTGEVVNRRRPDDPGGGTGLLILVRVPELEGVAFAVADPGSDVPIALSGGQPASRIWSCRLCRQAGPNRVALRHPQFERYLCAHPWSAENDPEAPTVLDRSEVHDWETFDLEMAPAGIALSPDIHAAIAACVSLLAGRPGPATVLDWLDDTDDANLDLIGAPTLRLLSPVVRDAMAAGLMERPERATRLGLAWPGDHRTQTVLPDLLDWTRHRSSSSLIQAGPMGARAALSAGGDALDVPARLVASVRARIEPKRNLAVLSSARNEGVYLLDWIAHHRAIGVEHFFIYSNDNDDASDRLLRCLAAAGIVTHLPNRLDAGGVGQQSAFAHAFAELPQILDYRWTATIDVDEFITLDPARFSSLPAFLDLQDARGADAVALNWHVFTSSGLLAFEDRPVPDRLRWRKPLLDPHVKTIVRTGRAVHSSPHAPVWPVDRPGNAFDARGVPHHGSNRPFWDCQFRHQLEAGPAWVNHYLFRSLPEFVWKASRNRGDQVASALRFAPDYPLIASFAEWFDNPDAVEDRTILAWSDRAIEERRRLLALDGVRAAHGENARAFERAIADLMDDLVVRAEAVASPHGEIFRAIVRDALHGAAADARSETFKSIEGGRR